MICVVFMFNGVNFLQIKKNQHSQKSFESIGFSSDLDRIQTCNLLSRNQVRYSVAPRGLFKWVQI